MTDTPITQRRTVQFRGPTNSDDYNSQVEERFRDLVTLFNSYNALGEAQEQPDRRTYKELLSLAMVITDLTSRIEALEADDTSTIPMGDFSCVDNDRFVGSPYEIQTVDELTAHAPYGFLSLPVVTASSGSALAFVDESNNIVVPETFEYRVVGDPDSADTVDAVIDSTGVELAVARRRGMVWERNVIADSTDPQGASLTLYIKVPTDVFPGANLNALMLAPYPVFSVDILEVATTTVPDVIMDDGDNYVPVNSRGIYEGDTSAIGWTPPGGWDGDEDERAGLRSYHFTPAPVTGIRIKLRARDYYVEGGKYVYTYGLNHLDAQYVKSLSSGRAMIQVNAPTGGTISSVSDVQPQIFNVIEAEIPDVFSYRVIWETGVDSGIYTETPVSLSEKVWVEVTLNKASDGTNPTLSGLVVTAS